MRSVLVVAPGYPPSRGGVEAHVGQVVAGLAALGDRVRVVAGGRGDGAPPAVRGVVVEQHRTLPVPGLSLAPGVVLAGAAHALRGRDRIVHVHSYHALSGLAALVGRWRPLVLTPHYHGVGHGAPARLLHRGYRHLGRAIFAAPAAIICVSAAEQARLWADFPSTRGRTTVIPNGTDVARIAAAEPWPGEEELVLVVGRLEGYKRVADVVAALVHLPRSVRLVVLGDGPARGALADRVAALGLAPRVRLLGGVSADELHRWLRTADVLVSLSEQEAFGMAPMEAAAAGARTVLSDIPAHREIVAGWLGSTARVVPDREPETVARAIGAALADSRSSGRVRVEVPTWAEVAAATRGVHDAVLAHDRGTVGPRRAIAAALRRPLRRRSS